MNRARRWVGRRFAGVAVAAAVYVVAFPFYGVDREFLGDEPSYLLYATSLAHGWGVDLRRAYEPDTRTWISTGPVESHAEVWRPDGPYASWHSIGLPIVLSPLAGRVPRSVIRAFMILFASALAYHLFALVRTTTGRRQRRPASPCSPSWRLRRSSFTRRLSIPKSWPACWSSSRCGVSQAGAPRGHD